jgi:hypothetical protein
LVPMINFESVMKLGFVLEWIYFEQYNWSFIEILLCVEYIIYLNYPKRLVCSHVSELRSLVMHLLPTASFSCTFSCMQHHYYQRTSYQCATS